MLELNTPEEEDVVTQQVSEKNLQIYVCMSLKKLNLTFFLVWRIQLWSLAGDVSIANWRPLDLDPLSRGRFNPLDLEPAPTLQRQFRLYIPFLGIARPQPQFPHSCVLSDLYIPRISLHISSSRTGRPILGIYNSLTDT
jgi:hypothetical protein